MDENITAKDLLQFARGGNQQSIASYLLDLLTKAGKVEDEMGYGYDSTRLRFDDFRTTRATGTEDYDPDITENIFSQDISFEDMTDEDFKRIIMENLVIPEKFQYDELEQTSSGKYIIPWEDKDKYVFGSGDFGSYAPSGRHDAYVYDHQFEKKYDDFNWGSTDSIVENWNAIQEGFKALGLGDIQSKLNKELFLTESKRKRATEDTRRKYIKGEVEDRYGQLTGGDVDEMSIENYLSNLSALDRKHGRQSRSISEKYDKEVMDNTLNWLESIV